MRQTRLNIQADKIIFLYREKKQSCVKISKKFNCCGASIRNILIRNKVKMRGKSYINDSFPINEDFFSVLDSKEKSYILGLMYADGWVNEKYNAVQIALQEGDSDILLKISNLMFGGRPLYKRVWTSPKNGKKTMGNELKVINKKLFQDLDRLGCSPRKSFTLQFPSEKLVPNHLISHFIRGYFDGDGSVMLKFKHGKLQSPSLNMISSISFIEKLQEYFLKTLNIKMGIELKKHYSTPMACLVTSKASNIRILYSYLYKDCGEMFLKRKYDKFKEVLEKTVHIVSRK